MNKYENYEIPEVPEGGDIPKDVTEAAKDAVSVPSPAPVPEVKPYKTPYGTDVTPPNYGATPDPNYRMPDYMASKRPHWTSPQWNYLGKANQVEAQTPMHYKAENRQVGLNSDQLFQKYTGYKYRATDFKIPEEWFDHNVPYALWDAKSNRLIKAEDGQEFKALLLYVASNGGLDYDPNIQEEANLFTADEINYMENLKIQALKKGDIESAMAYHNRADDMMKQNCRAGSCTYQQLQDFLDDVKTADEINTENGFTLGITGTPVKPKLNAMTVRDYLEWARQNNARTPDSLWKLDRGLQRGEAALQQAKYIINTAKAETLKSSMSGKIEDIDIPELPQNWYDLDEWPDAFKGIMSVPSPKIWKEQIDLLAARAGSDISSKLPRGYKAKIVPDYDSGEYELRLVSPDGIETDAQGNSGEEVAWEFTGRDMAGFRKWAKNNPDKYLEMMKQVATVNPKIVKSLMTRSGEYTEYQADMFIKAANQSAEAKPNKWDVFLQLFPEFWKKQEQIVNRQTGMNPISIVRDFMTDPNKPDAVKDLALNMVYSISPQFAGLAEIGNIVEFVDDVFKALVYNAQPWENRPYKVWESETVFGMDEKQAGELEKVTNQAKALIPAFGLGGLPLQSAAFLLTRPKGEVLPWVNPVWWLGGGEIKLASTGAKGLVARAASMLVKGKSKVKVVKALAEDAVKAGVKVTDVVDDAEKLAKTTACNVFNEKTEDVLTRANRVLQSGNEAEIKKSLQEIEQVLEQPEMVTDHDHWEAYKKLTDKLDTYKASTTKQGATETPKVEAPKVEAPKAEAPKAEAPKAEAPKAETPKAETPKAEATKLEDTGTNIIEKRKQELKNSIKEAWDAQKRTGIVANPKKTAELEAQMVRDMAELARIYIREGINTVEAFAREIGMEVNSVLAKAFNEAKVVVEKHPEWNVNQEVAVQNLNRTGSKFKELSAKNDEAWHEKLKGKFAEVKRIRETMRGDEATRAAERALYGMKEEVGLTPEDIFIGDEDRLILMDMLQSSGKLSDAEWHNAAKALNRLFDEGRIPRPHEVEYFKRVFGDAIDNIIDMHSKMGTGWYESLLNAVGMLKSAWASFDLSYTGRQGAILALGNPKLAFQSTIEELRALASEVKYNNTISEVQNHRLYNTAKNAGLRESWGSGTKTEEAYVSDWGMYVPVMKNFNRAGLAFINNLRFRKFYQTLESWERAGRTITEKETKELAAFINEATGATNLVSKFGIKGKAAATTNALLFSPQYVVSRFAVWRHAAASPAVRKEFFKSMAAWIGANITLVGAVALSQKDSLQSLSDFAGDLFTDPLSPEGGKLTFGGTVLDPWAGEAQVARLLVQLATGLQKNPETGNITQVNRNEVFQRFIRGKVSPISDLLITFASGKDYEGRKLGEDLTAGDIAYETLVPGAIQDIVDGFDKEGILGALKASVSMIGIGVYTKDESDRVISAFYNEKKYLEEKEDEINALVLQDKKGEAETYIREHPELNLKYDKSTGRYKSAEASSIRSLEQGKINKIRQQIKKIQASPSLSDDEKKQEIKELKKQQAKIMKEYLVKIKSKQGESQILAEVDLND